MDNADAGHDSVPPEFTLLDLHKNISDLSNKICGKLDKLSDEVRSMGKKIEDLEDTVEFNSQKITKLEKEDLPRVEKRTKDQLSELHVEKKITLMEIYNRKNNLLFYGIKESQNEEIFDVLRNTFITLGLDERRATEISIVNAHRLPRRTSVSDSRGPSQPKGSQPAPSPIIAKFLTIPDRDAVLNAFEQLQRQRGRASTAQSGPPQNRISVRTDLPPALKVRRSILATEAFKLRRDRGVSTKIVLQEDKVILKWKEKGSTRWNTHE